uniref:Dynein axonemal assembly factor 11-like CS domain-containing protein n=1 Tax=Neobodo designis TaxID=312471 RepID=A0A7S1QKX6_NEODS|mmetsp:Transcript_47799/g.147433  ORF Transcript_47799/g.147433 Transcript_47799/m.147433 type:complete len:374 (+) Transcript_47799:132-1253(+)|eukprot:CAMPEP_0174830262 /NCGR_PEP_ID=MMETSP1114-20130205/2423_1 /TAXON_ID=312471 /ORGANISM="Neobodo designis, Strain CCAP 1951/1" /LENGTH=373 /DNA_ID=CAMNT_0016064053 /DNA_START=132 /DNA_END=1253 /DNA_ORIENTATION=-
MRITTDLLRRRSEHNEMVLSTLKEIALHQQEIEKIEVIGDVCRELEIIYLCNNYIPRIEGLRHLKFLTYLNLAVNNITEIDGLEGCESLVKLDLTVNFIPDPSTVPRLRANIFLETLHLTGNPCTNVPGYRHFVVQALPQLKTLDGEEIVRSEKIVARQDLPENTDNATEAAVRAQEEERVKAEMIAQGIDPFPPRFNEKGERVYGHTPEERLQILREQKEEEEKRKEKQKPAGSFSAMADELKAKPKMLTPEEEIEKYGRVLLRNEAKVDYRYEDDSDDRDDVVLFVQPGKFISTTSIDIDAQPSYIRILIKGKVLQLVHPVDVAVDKISVQRAQTTGELKLTMPVAAHVLQERKEKRERRKRMLGGSEDID